MTGDGLPGAGGEAPTPGLAKQAVAEGPGSTPTQNGSSARVALYRKIAQVYETVCYIQKDKRNAFHGYSYASEAAIKGALHEAFRTAGLIMLPPDILELTDGERDAKGQFLTTIKVRFGIADPETGEILKGTVYGRGQDNMDKGPYKALTGAMKYFLTTTFLIPTGDDPEVEPAKVEPVKAAKPVPAAQPIDTGGHPLNTQSAADFVAAAKIAAKDGSTRNVPWKTMREMKARFVQVRHDVGETAWMEELARYNWRSLQDLCNAVDNKSPNAKEKVIECYWHLDARKEAA